MSITSLAVSAGNPVTSAHVTGATPAISKAENISVKDVELPEFTAVLAAAHETFTHVLSLPDYVPTPDTKRFPRLDVHRPTSEQNPLNAWAWRATVKDTTDKSKGGLLEGKTIALKDNYALAGVPCLMGTEVIKDWTPIIDATAATRALEAGATIIGKGVCENLSLFGSSFSSGTGPIHNPYAKGYSVGGSTSGCAVLIATNNVDMALGGDQGGSIRLPASHTGIVGFKPTFGLIPYTGIGAMEPTIDHTGPMAKTVLEVATLLQAVAGPDGIDDRQQAGCPALTSIPNYPALAAQPIAGMKVGILTEGINTSTADPRVSELIVKAAKQYEALGATVEEVSIPGHVLAPDLWMVVSRLSATEYMLGRGSGRRGLVMNDLSAKHLPWTQEKFDKLWVSGQNILINGLYAMEHLDPTLLGKATNLVRKVRDEYNAALAQYDVIVLPTIPFVPRKLGSADDGPIAKLSTCAGLTLNSCPFNVTGHPAMSIPVGFLPPINDPEVKLPIGMQIVGKWWDDATVLQFGHAWETTNDWKTFAA
ncbi:amidase signature domain-containing protein [Mucidula mucida]|nr:amidase signature domain-containing protein [Mucidula mucida]